MSDEKYGDSSVFNFPEDELKHFKEVYLPIKDFDELWEISIDHTRQTNKDHPAIDHVIHQIYNESSYSVARDVFQIMLWREELIKANKGESNGQEKISEEESKD